MKIIKRTVSMLCAAVLLAGVLMPSGVKAESKAIPQIKLSIGNGQSTPTYQAGQSVKLELHILNQGTAQAENVTITPALENAADWPFEIESMNYEKKIQNAIASGQEETVSWDFKVRSDVESKSYRLNFVITYDDGTNEYEDDKKYIYVKAVAKEGEKPPAPQGGGEKPGAGDAGSSGTDGTSGSDSQIYGMDGGIVNGDPVASGGDTGSAGSASIPRVIVTGFSTDPGEVKAGSDFKLVVHVKNTATWTGVSNMLFDFQAPSSGTEAAAEAPAFLPSSGSSSVYLENIPAGETRDITIDLNARADLVQKPYSIVMSMKYEDGNQAQYEGNSSLAIPVKQAARFEFSEIKIAPESIAVGEEANITCSLYNTGRIKLYNVKAKFQGDGIEGEEIFIGNLESGATGTIDGIITGTSQTEGDGTCKMVVSYEDEAGKASTIEKEFVLTVMEQAEPADMAEMMPMEEEKGFPVLPVVIAALLLLIVIVVIVVLKMRKKKKIAIEEEELLDEVDRFIEDEHIEP
ncbi:hypothetical protein OCV51_00970 [Faecalicatena acetigenes]|uniref:CARDB domain-containing protein n=1 Tax=Faecalicatena acetigenes TaxID=2981790 RepID=A0ABT2T8B1_9FIRM|nr:MULTISPECIES: CARDB domain-containing protein [Lachnospiraceae]MCU6746241.1 hypothetical protein [Faecalicatena acetigenes]SCH03121.1 putative carboxyl-terminal-processing protease%2C deltaproteobacterial [uncultured Clostridium sp.]